MAVLIPVKGKGIFFSLVALALFLVPLANAQPAARPAPFDDLSARAAQARDEGQLEEALMLYRKALAARPKWDEGRWYEATLLYELDRYAEANDGFSAVLRREPAHAGALGLRGLCEFELRQYDAALADLLHARKMGVGRSAGIATVVAYHAAVLLTRAGEFEIANQMLTEFVAEGTDTTQVIEAFGLNVLRMPMLPSEFPPAAREQVLLAGHAGYAMAARQVGPARMALDASGDLYVADRYNDRVRRVTSLGELPAAASHSRSSFARAPHRRASE